MERLGESNEVLFEQFVESLDERTLASPKVRKILDEIEESGDFEKGLRLLNDFKIGQTATKEKMVIRHPEGPREINEAGVAKLLRDIEIKTNDKEKFLGSGATAAVCTLQHEMEDKTERMVCAKIIRDHQQYDLGATVHVELEFLDRLSNLNVRGVRTPKPLFSFSSLKMTGLAMENLDAVNLEQTLKDRTADSTKEKMPASFNVEEYFDCLREYIVEMHKLGIIHNDIAPRNMMIDRETGLPRVIDFGRSQLVASLKPNDGSIERAQIADLNDLKKAESNVRAWLGPRV